MSLQMLKLKQDKILDKKVTFAWNLTFYLKHNHQNVNSAGDLKRKFMKTLLNQISGKN